jgi:hypothetical protein
LLLPEPPEPLVLPFPFPLPLPLLLSLGLGVGGGRVTGGHDDSYCGGHRAAPAAEDALLLRAWSRTWRSVPGPLSCPARSLLEFEVVEDGVEGEE